MLFWTRQILLPALFRTIAALGPAAEMSRVRPFFFQKETTHPRDLVISSYALWERFVLLYACERDDSSLCRAVL